MLTMRLKLQICFWSKSTSPCQPPQRSRSITGIYVPKVSAKVRQHEREKHPPSKMRNKRRKEETPHAYIYLQKMQKNFCKQTGTRSSSKNMRRSESWNRPTAISLKSRKSKIPIFKQKRRFTKRT